MQVTVQSVEQIIVSQRNYFHSGATKTVAFRKAMLAKLKQAIKRYEQKIMNALEKDLGKSNFESYVTEVGFVQSSISYMMKHVDEWMEPEVRKTPLHLQPASSYIVREPYGSILIISPFNYPFQLVMEPLIGAIVGGNCAVVKPSELAQETAAVITEIIEEIFPPEYVKVVHGEKEATTSLLHASFDYIFFTGSVAIGKVVMEAAAKRLIPVTLELGGKSPVIVDQTANLTHAAERIVWGKFTNTGQTCVAPDYVVVHASVAESFTEELMRVIRQCYGNDAKKSKDYGRIINEQHLERLANIIDKERNQIMYGGKIDRDERYIEPTLLANCTWDSPSMKDEIFGPILPIIEYENLGEVIHKIRQLPKSLAAYLFSENEAAIDYFTENLSFGGGCINDTVSHVGNIHLPFGGVGTSGMNAYHGKDSFELFTHAKSLMKRSTKIPMRIALPPYKNKLKLIKPLIR